MSKNRVIVEAVLAGKSQREVARLYGVSQPRVSQLLAAWRSGGWQALEPQSRRPLTNPNATPTALVARICRLRKQLVAGGLDAGPITIATLLEREGHHPPAPSTIWAILTRAGLVTPQPRKRPKRAVIRFAADLPNECWQSDFTHWRLAGGRGAEILLFLDDHSRYLISATAHTTVTGPIVVAAFRAAMKAHGTPASTLTDNGLVFTSRHLGGPNGFETELARLNIEQKNGNPNHPQTQGKVERLNQTLKRWLRARPPAATTADLQAQLDEFAHHYNHRRPHRSLGGATPQHAYTARDKATPEHNPGHWRIRDDTVNDNGTITLRHAGRLHHIGLGRLLARTRVRMLVHGKDLMIIDRDTAEILRELTLDTTRDYQPTGRPPGPPKGSPRRGGRNTKAPHNNKPKK